MSFHQASFQPNSGDRRNVLNAASTSTTANMIRAKEQQQQQRFSISNRWLSGGGGTLLQGRHNETVNQPYAVLPAATSLNTNNQSNNAYLASLQLGEESLLMKMLRGTAGTSTFAAPHISTTATNMDGDFASQPTVVARGGAHAANCDPFDGAEAGNNPVHLPFGISQLEQQLALTPMIPVLGESQLPYMPPLALDLLQLQARILQQQEQQLLRLQNEALSAGIGRHCGVGTDMNAVTGATTGAPSMDVAAAVSLVNSSPPPRRLSHDDLERKPAANPSSTAVLRTGSTSSSPRIMESSTNGTDNNAILDSAVVRILPKTVSHTTDSLVLSQHQVYLRQQIEFFQATASDVATPTRGRTKRIAVGQVGIRCRHCANVPPQRRQVGSTYFPTEIWGFYQAAQNMCTTHLQCGRCESTPDSVKEHFKHLLEVASRSTRCSSAGRAYWAKCAEEMGLVNTEDGIFHFQDLPLNVRVIHG